MLTVPTAEGDVYFKATARQMANETALTVFLADEYPDLLPDVLASDASRKWLLMRDGGTRLRDVMSVDRDFRHWELLLPRYAELQIEMVAHRDYLLLIQTPDHRLAKIPALLDDLLASEELLRIDRPEGLTREEAEFLHQYIPVVARMAEELAGHSVPESLDHGDCHDGNVLVRDGRYVLFDWGDSTVAHPFFSLRTVFVSLENTLDLCDEAVNQRLLGAYLEPWLVFEPRKDLMEGFELARSLCIINRAFAWQYYVTRMDEENRAENEHGIPALLKEFLDSMGATLA